MSMQSKARFAAGLLEVEVQGEFSIEEAKRSFLETLENVGRHGATKVLIDGRTLTGEPGVIERFIYGEFAAAETARASSKHKLSRTPRFAYVLKEPMLDPRRFGENVAANRGMIIKVFENREEAIEWLGTDFTGKPVKGK